MTRLPLRPRVMWIRFQATDRGLLLLQFSSCERFCRNVPPCQGLSSVSRSLLLGAIVFTNCALVAYLPSTLTGPERPKFLMLRTPLREIRLAISNDYTSPHSIMMYLLHRLQLRDQLSRMPVQSVRAPLASPACRTKSR